MFRLRGRIGTLLCQSGVSDEFSHSLGRTRCCACEGALHAAACLNASGWAEADTLMNMLSKGWNEFRLYLSWTQSVEGIEKDHSRDLLRGLSAHRVKVYILFRSRAKFTNTVCGHPLSLSALATPRPCTTTPMDDPSVALTMASPPMPATFVESNVHPFFRGGGLSRAVHEDRCSWIRPYAAPAGRGAPCPVIQAHCHADHC